MVNSGQIKGVIMYLTQLTHTVGMFRFKFGDIEYSRTHGDTGKIIIEYNLYVELKEKDIIWLWDYLSCKSKHIIEESCRIVSVSFGDLLPVIKNIYVDGFETERYGGYTPDSFIKKVSEKIQSDVPKQIKTYFYCEGQLKHMVLIVDYEISDMYLVDGLTTDVSVYCSQILVDGEPLENITQDLAETIVGYVSEDDSIKQPLDTIVWNEINKYMNLEDCEIWTHTYPYVRNIGDIEVEDFDYINRSIFSSKMCDFISGDY
jgi:hypothetical protein